MDSEDKHLELLTALKDVVEAQAWHHIGELNVLKESSCKKLYGEIEADDVVLIYDKDTDSFHAMDAVCSHEGGPLELGDIEEIGGNRCIVCPWHNYEFKLSDGCSDSSGLQQEIYPVMVLNGHVYIRTGENEVTLEERRSKQPQMSSEVIEKSQTPKTVDDKNLTWAAYQILTAETPELKVDLSNKFGNQWLQREITSIGNIQPPKEPSRNNLNIVAPGREARRGKGGSVANRISILHSLANIELWAVDLSWDIVARFSHDSQLTTEFIDDFIRIALEETNHFHLLNQRMKSLGSCFGALSVHNALWDSAAQTEKDLLGRLAVVHMVHEARGLDVQPTQIEKFTRQKDWESVDVLKVVYEEEIGHVSLGLKWFHHICQQNSKNPVEEFHKTVRQNYRGYLKPPFNTAARKKAGMTPEWYEPLTKSYSLKQENLQANSARMYSTTSYRTVGSNMNCKQAVITPNTYMNWLKNIRIISRLK